MTPPNLKDQSDEALNRMLTELAPPMKCGGILQAETIGGLDVWRCPACDSRWQDSDRPVCKVQTYRPFTQSLDECARVEAGLTDEQQNLYVNLLSEGIDPFGELGWKADFEMATASGRQRTIALIQTLQQ